MKRTDHYRGVDHVVFVVFVVGDTNDYAMVLPIHKMSVATAGKDQLLTS